MPHNLKLATATVNAEADAIARLLDGGILRIYSGTQPATADTAISDQMLLAECVFAEPSCAAAVDGTITANPVNSDPSANASGAASWGRHVKADGSTPVMDAAVGATGTGSDIEIDNVTIAQGVAVSVTSWSYTAAKE